MRKLILAIVVTSCAVALWHGVYIPVAWLQPVTGPLLADRAVAFKADRAVVSLLPTPKLRLLNAELTSTLSTQALARAGLLTLTLHVKPGESRWLQLHALSAKEAEIWIDQTGAEGSNWSAWSRVPPRSDKKLRLPQHIIFENSHIYFQNRSIGSLSARLDQLRLLRDGSALSTLAIRLQNPDITGNLQATAKISTKDDNWLLENLQSEFAGQIGGYPWSLTGALEQFEQTDAEASAPLKLSHLRFYAKRDDDPDEHQAVFSAASVKLFPQDGRSFASFGEWTYTHEKAEAWSFHAQLDLALGRLKLLPAVIPGSEAMPARELDLNLRCLEDGQNKEALPQGKPVARTTAVWVWHEGWFFWAEELHKAANAKRSPTGAGANATTNATANAPENAKANLPRTIACMP